MAGARRDSAEGGCYASEHATAGRRKAERRPMVSPRSPVSKDEKARPVFWQRVLVTTACPVALVLIGARGSLESSADIFLVGALVFGTIAAALARTWFASIVGSVLAAIALVVLFALLFTAACPNGDCS
jgi:hypothetical protein